MSLLFLRKYQISRDHIVSDTETSDSSSITPHEQEVTRDHVQQVDERGRRLDYEKADIALLRERLVAEQRKAELLEEEVSVIVIIADGGTKYILVLFCVVSMCKYVSGSAGSKALSEVDFSPVDKKSKKG